MCNTSRLIVTLLLAACVAAGCGSGRESTGRSTAAATAEPAVHDRPARRPASTKPRRDREQHDDSPTVLLGGPFVFRFVKPIGFNYTAIFRLSRDPKLDVNAGGGEDEYLPDDTSTSRGNYAVGGYGLEPPPRPLGPPTRGSRCFGAEVPSTFDIDALDALAIGDRVRVEIQPLQPGNQGRQGDRRVELGRRYIRHPRLQATDTSFTAPAARAALKTIGCARAAAAFYDPGPFIQGD